MNNPILIIIRGLPGSGKTTLAKKIAKEENMIHLETDMYFETEEGYVYDNEKLAEAIRWFDSQLMCLLRDGKRVVCSNTFITIKSVENCLSNLSGRSRQDVLVVRLTNDYGTIHDITKEAIQDMKERFESYPGEVIF